MALQVETLSLQIYNKASAYAAEMGIIIADTKFEFGVDESTNPPTVVLADEVLTPDSSRFWDAAKYEIGRGQESFDKQHLRGQLRPTRFDFTVLITPDWLATTSQKGNEDVTMPEDIVANTSKRYKQAYQKLVQREWEDK